MGQGKPEEKKGKKEENKVVVKVDMDCEACKQRVRKVLKKFPGVENIDLDMDAQTATVKGNVDAYKVYGALRKKCGKRTMLVYPQFSKDDEKKAKEDAVINSVNKIVDSITDLLNPKPPDTTVELKVRMHCGACAKKIKRTLLRMEGVTEVEEDLLSDKVVVKGRALNAEAVCDWVRESGKYCEVVSFKKEEKTQEKKNGDKKAEEKGAKEEKSEEKQEKKNGGGKKGAKKGEDKEEKKDEKKEEIKAEDKKEGKNEGKNSGKQEVKADENPETKEPSSDGGQEGVVEVDVKKYAYTPYQSMQEYVYAPQIFSDENPNACSVM